MQPGDRFRFDVYGRFEVVLERVDGRWQVLEVGEDGKRSLLDDVAPPEYVRTTAAMRDWLEVCFHELGGPGLQIRLVD